MAKIIIINVERYPAESPNAEYKINYLWCMPNRPREKSSIWSEGRDELDAVMRVRTLALSAGHTVGIGDQDDTA
jgi:hypothetical protein